MTAKLPAPTFDGSFPHHWQAEILPARPLILPSRHFVYPTQAEEVERGALEVLIRPAENEQAPSTADEKRTSGAKAHTDSGARLARLKPCPFKTDEPFLATCALGFRDPAVPTGLWSTPNPDEICAVSGGYAYVIDTTAPERFTMIAYRPVLEIRPITRLNLLLFAGHHSFLAFGQNGQAWKSEKLSSEGLTITSIEGHILNGQGWDMMTDKEIPFALDLRTGLRLT
jgi:hypothetical protein